MNPPKKPSCSHPNLILTPSSHALTAGYTQPPLSQRLAATTSQGTLNPRTRSPSATKEPSPSIFPAPLVLPGDELAYDPTYPPQSFRSWLRSKDRNKITPERNIIYLAAPPEFEAGLEFAEEWTKPRGFKSGTGNVDVPGVENVRRYLEAFYHGMKVQLLPTPLKFLSPEEDTPPTQAPKRQKRTTPKSPTLWLNTFSSEQIGIRTRSTPKSLFTHQLNLNDLLDAAIDLLPSNAYALLLLTHHDIYEDDDDDFACGRAYGGSRVAVVSSARYNPSLDPIQGLNDMSEHSWPGSHCRQYVERICAEHENPTQTPHQKPKSHNSESEHSAKSPLASALQSCLPRSNATPSSTWQSRLSRTASHELGHCFGLDHCVYYACIMQGTASLIEDARQPPYLCPIDLTKVLSATGTSETARYDALSGFCKGKGAFEGYATWISARLEEIRRMDEEIIVID